MISNLDTTKLPANELVKVNVPTYNIAKAIDLLSISFNRNKEAWNKVLDRMSVIWEEKDYDLGI